MTLAALGLPGQLTIYRSPRRLDTPGEYAHSSHSAATDRQRGRTRCMTMTEVKLTLKNYRSFSDDNPLVLDIGPHFTALVGPNNSGKSSFLKLFFELRELWSQILSNIQNMFNPDWKLGVNYKGIMDRYEIFSNSNSRPLSIEIEIVDPTLDGLPPEGVLKRVILTCERGEPKHWGFQCFSAADTSTPITFTRATRKNSDTRVTFTNEAAIDCGTFLEIIKEFQDALYIGPFRNAINEGAGYYFDVAVGTNFITTWNDWKTGDNKAKNKAINRVTREIRKIFDHEELEINASADLKTLNINVDGNPHLLSELGSGLAQFIMVFGNAAIKSPSFILIDEPELNLHPPLQIDFITSLTSFATEGIIFATHSIGLARAVAERIYSFQKTNSGVAVKPFEATHNYTEFVGEMSFSAFKDMGCEKILLVEGVRDVKTVQQFLRMLKKDHQIVLLPLGGDQLARGNVELELNELTRLTNNIAALVDSERENEIALPIKARRQFEETCKKLNINVCVTERRAIENYFSDQAIKAQLGDKYRSLGPYERPKDCEPIWSKADGWRIARRMSFNDIGQTDLGQFLSKL